MLYYYLVFSLLYSVAVTLAFVAYLRIHKDFNDLVTKKSLERITKSEKTRRIIHYSQEFFAKPIIAFTAIIVISIVLTTALASTLYLPGSGEDNPEESKPYYDYVSLTRISEGTGILTEGESTLVDIPINGELAHFYARLTWEDEPNDQYYHNQPDCFSIEVDFGNRTETTTGENPTEDKGLISVNIYLNGTETFYVTTAKMTIILNYCGDNTGYWGHLPKPLAREDDSNDYYYYIKFTILNE
jgi:hypothetical protein